MARSKSSGTSGPLAPWWRFPIVWMVIAGPLAVVVAGIVTAVIAVQGADDVLSVEARSEFSERPAVQGRNHSATANQGR
jgi:uncharacterized protein